MGLRATLVNILGLTLKRRHKLDEAEVLYREGLQLCREMSGDDGLDTCAALNHLGMLLYGKGRPAEAMMPFIKEALSTARRTVGDRNAYALRSMNNLALLLHETRELKEAEKLYREALMLKQETLGDAHPATLTTLNNLGELISDQGNLEAAMPLVMKALAGRRKVLGDRHPDTLTSINNVGLFLQRQGNLRDAEKYMRESLQTSRETWGDMHGTTASSANALGKLLRDQGRVAAATELFEEGYQVCRTTLGGRHPDTLVSMSNVGLLMIESNRDALRGFALLRRVLSDRRAVLGATDPDTLDALTNLGCSLSKHGGNRAADHAEAERLLVEALKGCRAVFDEQHQRVRAAIENLQEHRNGMSFDLVTLVSGDTARITGLQGRADLNGRVVRLIRFDDTSGRWCVSITEGAGEVNIKIKQTNLEPDGDHATSQEQATSEPASMPNEVARLLHGRVRIGGLQGRSELNGQCGTATAYDAARDRVAVALGDGPGG